MPRTPQTPEPGSLPARLLDWFRRNPSEHLSEADIALKFDVPVAAVAGQLISCLANDLLRLTGRKEYGAGRKLDTLVEAPAPAAKPPAPAVAQPDPTDIVIEDGVAIPPPRKRPASNPWLDVFARMSVGQSVQLETEAARRLISTAQNYGKKNARKFETRKVSDTHSRIWRTA